MKIDSLVRKRKNVFFLHMIKNYQKNNGSNYIIRNNINNIIKDQLINYLNGQTIQKIKNQVKKLLNKLKNLDQNYSGCFQIKD